jgi:hypothetical protein
MRSIFRVAAVTAAAIIPVVGLSTTAAVAKPKPKAAKQILVTASPNPIVETATSDVVAVVQVEAMASDAGSAVTLSSTQLSSRCSATFFGVFTAPGTAAPITLTLDNDGNASAIVSGRNCAPGSALIDASLDAPPFSTAITKLVIEPPQVTPPGVRAFPNPMVEVGDGAPPAVGAQTNVASEAQFVSYVETAPVYAEQDVTITSDQLTERCGGGFRWVFLTPTGFVFSALNGPTTGRVITNTIDNDGNSVSFFFGSSCAAGKSTIIADIENGGPTYSTQFNILPPAVTI